MKKLILTMITISLLGGCVSVKHTMKQNTPVVELKKDDFKLSPQVSGEATCVKVLLVDWARLFRKKEGVVGSDVEIPIIGGFADRTGNYALYNLMAENPGYDVAFYPQFEKKVSKPIIGIGILFKKTTVKATTRLGKLTE